MKYPLRFLSPLHFFQQLLHSRDALSRAVEKKQSGVFGHSSLSATLPEKSLASQLDSIRLAPADGE